MSADVSIELACQPRSALGSSGLLAAVKAQGQAGLIEQLARRDVVAPEQLRVDLGRGDEPLDYRALQAAAAPLTDLAAACAGCPANVFRPTFGCLTAIRYPIAADAETWLGQRLPSDGASRPGFDLLRAIRDFGLDGARGAEMRRRGFLEGPRPAVGRIGDEPVTSEQVLEILLFSHHGIAVMRMLLLAFGAVEAVPPDLVEAAYRGEVPLQPALLPRADDPRSIGDFKRLFVAFLVGSRLDAEVRVAP